MSSFNRNGGNDNQQNVQNANQADNANSISFFKVFHLPTDMLPYQLICTDSNVRDIPVPLELSVLDSVYTSAGESPAYGSFITPVDASHTEHPSSGLNQYDGIHSSDASQHPSSSNNTDSTEAERIQQLLDGMTGKPPQSRSNAWWTQIPHSTL